MSPAVLVLSVAAALVYATAAVSVPWPPARTFAFIGGIAVLTLAPLCDLGSVASHMAEHGVLMSVAAPMLAFSAPISLVSRKLTPARRASLRRLLHSSAAGSAARALPIIFVPVVWIVHAPPIADRLETMPLAHAAEHLLFTALAAGVWSVAFGRLPGGVRRMASRGLVMLALAPASDLAAIALMAWGEPAAAAVMLVSTLPFAIAGVALLWRAALQEERIDTLVRAAR